MKFEDEIFLSYSVDRAKLVPYGFKRHDDAYVFEKDFKSGAFTAVVSVDQSGNVTGKVVEKEFEDEYTQVHVDAAQGAFVSEIRSAYGDILLDIRGHCFLKQPFISQQANRIAQRIEKEYGEIADYPFSEDRYKSCGVFRFKGNGKWYALVMNIERKRFENIESDDRTDVLNVKIDVSKRTELLDTKGIFPAYHMNKQKWISVILDGSLSDDYIMNLIGVSRDLVIGKAAKKKK